MKCFPAGQSIGLLVAGIDKTRHGVVAGHGVTSYEGGLDSADGHECRHPHRSGYLHSTLDFLDYDADSGSTVGRCYEASMRLQAKVG